MPHWEGGSKIDRDTKVSYLRLETRAETDFLLGFVQQLAQWDTGQAAVYIILVIGHLEIANWLTIQG